MDRREDPGQYYPDGSVMPGVPVRSCGTAAVEVVAPDENAQKGQAADAKATGEALRAKADAKHEHEMSDVEGLEHALGEKDFDVGQGLSRLPALFAYKSPSGELRYLTEPAKLGSTIYALDNGTLLDTGERVTSIHLDSGRIYSKVFPAVYYDRDEPSDLKAQISAEVTKDELNGKLDKSAFDVASDMAELDAKASLGNVKTAVNTIINAIKEAAK